MTRRILAGFLGVLLAVIAAVVVPLGVLVTAQQRDDFRDGTRTAARAVAGIAEEQLDDRKPAALAAAMTKLAAAGDRIAVLDPTGSVVSHTGTPLPVALLAAAHAGRPLPLVPGGLVETAPIGDSTAIGLVVIVRNIDPLTDRQHALWAWLGAAASAALLVGAAVAWQLSRWIARPLHSLARAAHRVGAGDTAARADPSLGPPQVRQVAAAFNLMGERLTSLIETQRGMTAEVSHQLRTPLTALRLRLELLATDLDQHNAAEVAAVIEETNRLSRLLDGLLAAARAEATTTVPEPVELAVAAAERVTAWRPVADERDVTLRLTTTPAIALATPGHLEQILDNLLDNALTAIPAGAQITVTIVADNTHAVLAVADNGPGMSPERRTRTLDRYYTNRAGDGGTGLGLHVVARLVSTDHGTTALHETPGGGLTVEIRLPSGPRRI